MREKLTMTGLILLVASLTAAEAADQRYSGKDRSGQQQVDSSTTESACDCCQKCRAAKRPITSKEERPADNGCKDCCERCGDRLPAPEEIPPEIIEKRIPPEIQERRIPPVMKEKGTQPEITDDRFPPDIMNNRPKPDIIDDRPRPKDKVTPPDIIDKPER